MDDITSIIFDLGGVILDIDYKRTESAFQELGIPDFAKLYSQLRQDSLFDDLEMGLIDPQSFRERIRSFSRTAISDPQICLLYTSPSPRDRTRSRMPSSA